MPSLVISVGPSIIKATGFNQQKNLITVSPQQKTDIEKYIIDPKSQPQVIKFLEQALDGCPHCQHDATYKWGR